MADNVNKGDRYDASTARQTLRQLKQQGRSGFDVDQDAHRRYRETGEFAGDEHMKPWWKRVSHDSEKYPRTTANLFLADVTGSLMNIPQIIVEIFPKLMETLFAQNLQEDPAWCFATFGDFTDRAIASVSLQVGQFELDQKIDDWPRRAVLHGGGLGNGYESSEIALWMAGNHMELHNIVKRELDPTRRRGELIMVTDDKCLLTANHIIINNIMNVETKLKKDVPIEQIISAARKNFIVTVLIPKHADGGQNPKIFDFWNDLLGPDTVDGVTLPNPVRRILDAYELGTVVPELIAEHKKLLSHE